MLCSLFYLLAPLASLNRLLGMPWKLRREMRTPNTEGSTKVFCVLPAAFFGEVRPTFWSRRFTDAARYKTR